MQRRSAVISSLVCAIIIGASSALILSEPIQPKPSPYILRDYGGKLALFKSGQAEPTVQYEIYTQLLPTEDVEALRYGINIDTPEQLNSLLEDLDI